MREDCSALNRNPSGLAVFGGSATRTVPFVKRCIQFEVMKLNKQKPEDYSIGRWIV